MRAIAKVFKRAVTVIALGSAIAGPALAQSADVDTLLEQLANPETQNWEQVERQIRTEWSRSGSASMDLLYQRGEAALDAEEYDVALEHFTALTDHAPGFAEGWNGRATAFFRKGMYGPALDDLSRALAINPRHFSAMTGLAVILQETGLYRDALEVWRMVEAMHPHRAQMQDAIQALERQIGGARL